MARTETVLTATAGSPAEIRARWDAFSRHYDRQIWLERSAVGAAVELLRTRRADRCLDLGTGTGEVLRRLARQADRPALAIGVDLSPRMLERAGPLPEGWSVTLGDIRGLPFGDASYDAASISFVLHLLDAGDRFTALTEIRRVLRPGGRLVTVTPAIPRRGAARSVALGLDRLAQRSPSRYGGLRALDPSRELAAAGFDLIRSRWSLRGYPSLVVLARA